MTKLENKCEDLESRLRNNNQDCGGPRGSGQQLHLFVAPVLKEACNLSKKPLLDSCHRTLQPKLRAGERPCSIIARLLYHSDCIDILWRVRKQGRINIRNMAISIFPDHVEKIARVRAAFNEVRCQLRGMEGVRYGLIHLACLRTSYAGEERVFQSSVEAQVFIKKIHAETKVGNVEHSLQ